MCVLRKLEGIERLGGAPPPEPLFSALILFCIQINGALGSTERHGLTTSPISIPHTTVLLPVCAQCFYRLRASFHPSKLECVSQLLSVHPLHQRPADFSRPADVP